MPEAIGVAVIGTGSIAEAHLYAYQKADQATLIAVFYYVLKGGVTLTLDGVTRPITEGHLVMIPPGVRHTSDGEMDVLIVGVPPQEATDIHFD